MSTKILAQVCERGKTAVCSIFIHRGKKDKLIAYGQYDNQAAGEGLQLVRIVFTNRNDQADDSSLYLFFFPPPDINISIFVLLKT